MTFFCTIEKFTKEDGWRSVWSSSSIKHGNKVRLKVEGKMNAIHTDVLKVSEEFTHVKGRQVTVSVLGFTWRYCCDEKEVVMISSGRDTMFILNI